MRTSKLYKYLDIQGGASMLYYRNLQFTNATQLNDPFDCHPSLIDFSNIPPEKCHGWPADIITEVEKNQYERNYEKAWICSLSKIHNSLLMWSYYNKHQGVCIGLNMEKAQKYISRMMGGIMGCLEVEVEYKEVINRPNYFKEFQDFMHYQIATKAKDWAHEKEVRLVCFEPLRYLKCSPEQAKRKHEISLLELRAYLDLGAECFDSVYLGVNINQKKRKQIIELAQKCNPEIKIFQMAIDPDAFKLREKLIRL